MRTDVLLGLTVAGTLGIGVAVVVFGSGPSKAANDPRTSSLVSGPSGSQALYEVLAELRVPVQRRRTTLFDIDRRPERIGRLAVLAPVVDLLPAELNSVVRFLRGGGDVIVAGDGGGITSCAGYRARRGDGGPSFDAAMVELGRPYAVRPPAGARRLPPTRRVLARLDTADVTEGFVRPRARQREATDCELLAPHAVDTLLRTSDNRPVMLQLTYASRGRLVLVADPVYVRNRSWRETDAATLMVPLLTPSRRGPLVWDEYHQGFAERNSDTQRVVQDWLRSTPAGWALLQLAAVALVWLLVTAVRFGPARSVIERRRRSPLEHVEALAAGLAGAQGSKTAVDLIVAGLRRRLSRTGHIGSSDLVAWLGALELACATPRGRDAARRLLGMLTQRGGDELVLAAAQAVEDVWQDLRPAQTPARS